MRPSRRAAPGDAASAARTRRRPVDGRFASGESAAWMGASPAGDECTAWHRNRCDAPRPDRPEGATSSSSCGVTPATGGARPASREARTSRLAAYSRPSGCSWISRSRSSAKSRVPKTRRDTPSLAATASTFATPAAVSIKASTPQPGSAARRRATACEDSTLGSMSMPTPTPCSHRASSSSKAAEPTSLTRTTARARSTPAASRSQRSTAARRCRPRGRAERHRRSRAPRRAHRPTHHRRAAGSASATGPSAGHAGSRSIRAPIRLAVGNDSCNNRGSPSSAR